ncbi:MAG: DciA family protein [Solirubrobacteraceae bacterium]
MGRYRRAPRPLGDALDRARRSWEPATPLAEVQRVWLETVGEAIAAEAKPVKERSGVLTVACAASVWAHELDLMGPVIVQRLNEAIGRAQIERLRCVTGSADQLR